MAKVPVCNVVFEAIAPARAVDDIAARIRSMVVDGRLRPGDRLPSERDLAQLLKVSRNTLREAFRTLENAGLIEMRKGASGGAFVKTENAGVIVAGMNDLYHLGVISPQQLTQARIWLSELVVRAACPRITDKDLALLDANIQAASIAHKQGQFDARQRLNREFHVLLAGVTRNPIISVTMASVMSVFGQFIEKIGPSENPYTLPSRRRFMRHLRSGNADAAALEMSRHLHRLHREYLARWTERTSVG